MNLMLLHITNLRIVLFLFLSFSLIGCVKNSSPDVVQDIKEHDAHTLYIQMQYEPASLDPSLVEDGAAFRILPAFMSGLFRYNDQYQLVPDVVESFKIQQKKYLLHLRKTKWSSGKPVTAHDFVFSFKRTLDPLTFSKLADLLFCIEGARAYKKGEIKDFSKVGVKALSDYDLEFTLERPTGYFLHILTLAIALPQQEQLYQTFGSKWIEHAESNGPFKLIRWNHDRVIEFEENPYYPKTLSHQGAIERIKIFIVPEESVALDLFRLKKLDVLMKVPAFEFKKLSDEGLVRNFEYFGTYYIGFDQRQSPWDNKNAREAFARLIKRDAILLAINEPFISAKKWMSTNLTNKPSSLFKTTLDYDPEIAKKKWKSVESSFVENFIIKLGTDTNSRNSIVMQQIQQEIFKSLQLTAIIEQYDWKTYLKQLTAKPSGIFRFGWLMPFVHPYASFMAFESKSLNNYTGWKSKIFDQKLEELSVANEKDTLAKISRELDEILVSKEIVVVPLFHYVQSFLIQKDNRVLERFKVNGLGQIDYLGLR